MDQEEVKKRAADLKARYSNHKFIGFYPELIEPGAIFSIGDHIFIGDLATNSLRKYSFATREIVQTLNLTQDRIGWSCGYDKNSGKIYLVSTQKKDLLLIDPNDLHILDRIPVQVENGIFFTLKGDSYFIPGLASPHSVKIIRNHVLQPSNISIQPSSITPDFIPFPFYFEDDLIGLYYIDSREVLVLKDLQFSTLHRFNHESSGRLYRLYYLQESQVFLALFSQPLSLRVSPKISMYDSAFNFIRSFSFPECTQAGNFCLSQSHIFLTSQSGKYVAQFQYDPRAFLNQIINK